MQVSREQLKFYFITDDGSANMAMPGQVETALEAGATVIQYRKKNFSLHHYDEALAIRRACRKAGVPLIINDHVLLAKAIDADGVHVGQGDDNPQLAREILGPQACIGLSVSTMEELQKSDVSPCDYIGCGPVFPTDTKSDANPACGLAGLEAIAAQSALPIVAIGGIGADNAADCLRHGADGVAVISAITRAQAPVAAARELAAACGLAPGR